MYQSRIVFSHLMEGIGIALDRKGGRMFITDFAGSVYSANLDGSNQKTVLFAQGNPAPPSELSKGGASEELTPVTSHCPLGHVLVFGSHGCEGVSCLRGSEPSIRPAGSGILRLGPNRSVPYSASVNGGLIEKQACRIITKDSKN